MKKYLGLLALIIFFSCSTKKKCQENVSAEISAPSIVPSFIFASGPCFGFCPIFEIHIDSTASAKLYGKRFTYPSGIFSSALPIEQKLRYLELIERVNWDSVPASFPTRVADAQGYSFEYNGEAKTSGNFEMPSEFDSLRQFFFNIEESLDWKASPSDSIYDKIELNSSAFAHFLEEPNIQELKYKYPFLENSSISKTSNQKGHVYWVRPQNSNLDYEALKSKLARVKNVDRIEPAFELKKKKHIIQGDIHE